MQPYRLALWPVDGNNGVRPDHGSNVPARQAEWPCRPPGAGRTLEP
jgi:hypothetical protein